MLDPPLTTDDCLQDNRPLDSRQDRNARINGLNADKQVPLRYVRGQGLTDYGYWLHVWTSRNAGRITEEDAPTRRSCAACHTATAS